MEARFFFAGTSLAALEAGGERVYEGQDACPHGFNLLTDFPVEEVVSVSTYPGHSTGLDTEVVLVTFFPLGPVIEEVYVVNDGRVAPRAGPGDGVAGVRGIGG